MCGYLLIGPAPARGCRAWPTSAWCIGGGRVPARHGVRRRRAADGFSPLAWAMIAGMALGPQLLGHSAFNYALRHVSATMIALAVLGEPVGSTLFALAVVRRGGWAR